MALIMKQTIGLLGLKPEEVTDEKVSGIIQVWKNKAAQLDAILPTVVQQALEKHKGVIVNREDWQAKLTEDYAGSMKLLEGLKAPAPAGSSKATERLLNRETAKVPADPNVAAEGDAKAQADKLAVTIRNRAQALRQSTGKPFNLCWDMAKGELAGQAAGK